MKALYIALITALQAIVLDPKYGAKSFYSAIYNKQEEKLNAKAVDGNRLYAIQLPAAFVEIDGETEQLGGGVQIYPELKVKIHLIHEQLDAGDGSIDQNTDVIDLQDIIYQALQGKSFPQTNELIRKHPAEDFSHDQLYHFVIEFETTFVDTKVEQPADSNNSTQVAVQTVTQPITPEVTGTI